MIIKTVKIYICSYCKKKKYTKKSCEIHELHCTKNPIRVCRMCGLGGQNTELINLKIAISGMDKTNEKELMEQLKNLSDGCPACMLAAIIQARGEKKLGNVVDPENGEIDYQYMPTFNYKEECKKYFEDTRREFRDEVF